MATNNIFVFDDLLQELSKVHDLKKNMNISYI